MKILIRYQVVPNTLEKGYFMYAFFHPIHGKKCIGCFKKSSDKHFAAACKSFALNCGYLGDEPSERFTFALKG